MLGEILCGEDRRVYHERLAGVAYKMYYMTEASCFRLGRKATKHVRTLFDRFWLQAADWLTANYVGFTPSTGNVGHVSPAMRISRSMRPESAFCDFIRSTPRS